MRKVSGLYSLTDRPELKNKNKNKTDEELPRLYSRRAKPPMFHKIIHTQGEGRQALAGGTLLTSRGHREITNLPADPKLPPGAAGCGKAWCFCAGEQF